MPLRRCEPTGRANARRRAPRRSNPCLSVIASAAKQSISLRKERLDCFVASLLAMTGSAKQSVPLRHCERSEAIHLAAQRKTGLLRRCAPLRKRFAFVAGNDGGARASRHCLSTSRTNARRRAPRSNPEAEFDAGGVRGALPPSA